MKQAKTLGAHLGVRIALSLLLVWVVATIVSLWVLMREMNASADKSLQETAQRLLPLAVSDHRLHQIGILDVRPDLSLLNSFDIGTTPRLLTDKPEYLLYQLRDSSGRVLLRSHNAPINPMLSEIRTGFSQIDNFRIFTASTADNRFHIQVAESAQHRYGALVDSLLIFILVFVLALPVSFIVVYTAVRQRLIPISRFTQAIATRHGNNLTAISQQDLPEDFTEVQEATNALLDRLRAALISEREFAANSAHELRTPIAVALAQLQRLRQELGETDQGVRLQFVEQSLKRLARLIDKLLQLARAESAALFSGQPTSVKQVVEMVSRELDPLRQRVELIYDTNLKLDLDPDALAVILSNLIENGLKYAPPESPVIVRITPNLELQVENLAPQLTQDSLTSLSERFVRGTDRSKPGSGLGLAIVGAFCTQLKIEKRIELVGAGRGQRIRVVLELNALRTKPTPPALPSPKHG